VTRADELAAIEAALAAGKYRRITLEDAFAYDAERRLRAAGAWRLAIARDCYGRFAVPRRGHSAGP
jgi:hypothetical protein